MGIIDNNKCSFCAEDIETLPHLFWNCKITRSFWNNILNWIATFLDTKIDFEVEELLFFCPVNEPIPFNFIFLLAKQHIYFCRNKQKTPNLFNFLNFLNVTKQIEYNIAKKNNRLHKFHKKWYLLS